MHFGKWIIVSFVLFAIFIATLVTVCVRQDVNLVSKDYYSIELQHQQKMQQIQNVRLLTQPPRIAFEGNSVMVEFNDFAKVESGKLFILRPSDEKLDQKFSFGPSSQVVQNFPLNAWQRGLYRATMTWTMDGKEFYYEKLILL